MFSVAHAVLWRSFPYPHPDRLVMVGEVDAHDPDSYWGASWPNLVDWRSRATSFELLAGVKMCIRDRALPTWSRSRS